MITQFFLAVFELDRGFFEHCNQNVASAATLLMNQKCQHSNLKAMRDG